MKILPLNTGGGDFYEKTRFALIALAALVLMVSAQAAEPRAISPKPELFFDGTTARSAVLCKGASSDMIEATLTLYQGTAFVDSWSSSSRGRVALSGENEAKSGKSYKLVLAYSINGESQSSISTTKTCP